MKTELFIKLYMFIEPLARPPPHQGDATTKVDASPERATVKARLGNVVEVPSAPPTTNVGVDHTPSEYLEITANAY